MMPHPRREVEFAGDLGQHVRGHLLATVYHVPLVHRQNQADRGLERVPRDVRVLRGDALRPVGQQDGDVGALQRMRGAQQCVVLDALLDTPAASDARGIHEHEAPAAELERCVEAVSRGAGDLADDGALAPDQRVEEARLADVRPTDDRDVGIRRRLVGLLRGQMLDDRIEEISRSVSLDRGDGIHVAQPELVELGGLRLAAPRVRLVRDEQDRLATAAELIGDVVLDRKDPRLRVDDEHDHVGLGDRGLGLAPDGRLHLAGLRIVETARVDERELAPAPIGGRVDTVSGGAGEVLDDRDTLADDAIEERRLPNVGPADNGNDGAGHEG